MDFLGQDFTVTFGLSDMVVDNTILGWPLKVKILILYYASENMASRTVFGFSLLFTNETPNYDKESPVHRYGK